MLTYSGRSSICLVLQKILEKNNVTKTWMPSYCCSSMIQPFIDLNIPVEFYKVDWEYNQGIIRENFIPHADDIVFSMSYFGFDDPGNDDIINYCNENNIIVIEDSTHRLFNKPIDLFNATYCIASLRKWFPLTCGGAIWTENEITYNLDNPSYELTKLKLDAMNEKATYLNNTETDYELKKSFLKKYSESNHAIANNYKNKKIDDWSKEHLLSFDLEDIRSIRKSNVEILLYGLNKIQEIKLIYPVLGEKDCPIFIPVITQDRDDLHRYLTKQSIYCPIHWARPHENADSNFYDHELSIICDQRYNEKEMNYILDSISMFYKGNK